MRTRHGRLESRQAIHEKDGYHGRRLPTRGGHRVAVGVRPPSDPRNRRGGGTHYKKFYLLSSFLTSSISTFREVPLDACLPQLRMCMSFYNNVNVLLYGSDNQGLWLLDRAKVFTVPPLLVQTSSEWYGAVPEEKAKCGKKSSVVCNCYRS